MFESTGLQQEQPSETAAFEELDEEYRLRWLGPLNNFLLLPASAIFAIVLIFAADFSTLQAMGVFLATYGTLSLLTLLVYDWAVPPATRRTFSDYLLLGLAVVRDSLWIILVAAVGAALSFLRSF